jgi:hypothetical protein
MDAAMLLLSEARLCLVENFLNCSVNYRAAYGLVFASSFRSNPMRTATHVSQYDRIEPPIGRRNVFLETFIVAEKAD